MMETLTASDINKRLLQWLSRRNNFLMGNVYVDNSPWESDVVAVTGAMFFTEYEIKVTVQDYRNDFRKHAMMSPRGGGFIRSLIKHPYYASSGKDIGQHSWKNLPRPARFFFVTPAGLLDNEVIPAHCGHIEVHVCGTYLRLEEAKRAPRLKNATKLSQHALFNLAVKSAKKSIWDRGR